ncbi:type I methionyl aminopeptidase [Paenibacillus sp. S-38]|uniref:type I methionyl aminopeptidase n=1 Tax=Paenibacillus sp. S-38 TaxID=3416710 RepID=UPI003CF47067
MSIETEEELAALQRIGRIVAEARKEMARCAVPGIKTRELDAIGKAVLDRYGAVSAPSREYDFPGTTCISVNHVAAHGIPDDTVLRDGDLVNIDVSAELGGYYADTGETLVVGQSADSQQHELCRSSLRALEAGLRKAKAGAKLSGIGRAVHQSARRDGFTVIRNLGGHGIGRRLHEEPEGILNYYDPSDGRLLTSGMVLAVETFVSTGAEIVIEDKDGWGLVPPDRSSYIAQFEHTIVITRGEPLILTA